MMTENPHNIWIMGLTQARRHKRAFDAVITIEDPDVRHSHCLRFHNKPHPAHLVLQFDDLDAPQDGFTHCTLDHAASALEFGRSAQGRRLMIHCRAGVARSTATALGILSDRLGPGQEQEAIAELVRLRNCAVPNFQMVEHMDRLLGRNGALLAAVTSWSNAIPGHVERRRLNKEAYLSHQTHGWYASGAIGSRRW